MDVSMLQDYFTRVLRRGRLEPVSFREAEPFIATTREQLATGRLTAEHTQALFEKHDRNPRVREAGAGREFCFDALSVGAS